MTRSLTLASALFLTGLFACSARGPLPRPVMPIHATARATFPAAPADPAPQAVTEVPELFSFALENGLQVFVLPRPELERVSVRYVMARGAESGTTIAQGTSTLALQLAREAMERHQVRLDTAFAAYTDRAGAQLVWTAAAEKLEASLEVLANVAGGTRATADSVRSGALVQLNQIEQELGDAETQAMLHARRVLYGDRHPLGQSTSGTRESVASLTFAALELQQRVMFAPEGSALILTGNVSADDAKRMVQGQLSAIQNVAAHGPSHAQAGTEAVRRTRGIVTPGHVAYVVHAFSAPEVSDVDRPAFAVLSMIAAELFSSRVRASLREQGAYTYDVSGHYQGNQRIGTWLLSFAVEGKDLGRALHAVDGELARLAGEGISEEELTRARAQLDERRAVVWEDPFDAAALVAATFLDGLSGERVLSALRIYGDLLEQVTRADVQRVAARYLRKEHRGTAVAGDIRAFHRGLTGWDRAIEWLVPAPVAEAADDDSRVW